MISTYNDLKNKKVLVTGALKGIGRSIALALAKNNCHVIINFRSREEEAIALCDELKNAGASAAHALCFDISDFETAKTKLTEFSKEHGPIEGLVNNAGISKDSLLLRLKPEDINSMIDINLKGPIFTTQILSRGFLKAENASIVNISSIVGLMGNPGQVAYSSSKAGLLGLTKSTAKELGSKNIRCNAICPGYIETEMTQTLEEGTRENYMDAISLGRFGSTDDVSNLTLFLLSQASSYITGEVIKIDGGLYI